MPDQTNVYCDESCHLEHDRQQSMVLGAVWCPFEKKDEIKSRFSDIRRRHKMSSTFEFKWSKIGPSKIQLYMDLIDYFFDDDDLHFRCLVVPDKSVLNHAKYNQSHDDWYYKQYFTMLKTLLRPNGRYNIYIDIKDTNSNAKVCKLHDVLCNNNYDYSKKIIQKVQQVRSHEVVQIQIADILIGAMSYKFRNLKNSDAKNKLIRRIAERSGYSLEKSTLYREEKFNIFVWRSSDQ